MHVLITGVSGFLGGHLASELARRGDRVTGIIRPSSDVRFLRPLGIDLLPIPLSDAGALCQCMKHVDVVIHAAAKVHAVGRWEEFRQTTIEGTRSVFLAAAEAGVRRFVLISTVGVYGFPSHRNSEVFDEQSPTGRIHRWNYYSRAKHAAEQFVLTQAQSCQIATTVIRPTWIYGPRDQAIFPHLFCALRSGRMKWIGDGSNVLSLIHVRDAVAAILLAAVAPQAAGQIYNVAADETCPTQREFLTQVCELAGLPLPTTTIPYRLAYAAGFAAECVAHLSHFRIQPPLSRLTVLLLGGNRRFSSKKIRQELGWQPTVRFADGLREAVEWQPRHRSPACATCGSD